MWTLKTVLDSCHPDGTYNFEVATRILRNLCTPAEDEIYVRLWTILVSVRSSQVNRHHTMNHLRNYERGHLQPHPTLCHVQHNPTCVKYS
jgi:hypothetical protein